MSKATDNREGSLGAPIRYPIAWQTDEYYDGEALEAELERVFDICHSCRRCFNLCHSFPTLFDAVDESPNNEIDTVPKEVFWDVVDHCYLCDMCYMTKCPYVPPHPWNVDFPHLMLRAKTKRFRDQGAPRRDRILASTDTIGKFAGIPVVVQVVNAINHSKIGRTLLEKTLGVHHKAPLPHYYSVTARKRLQNQQSVDTQQAVATANTRGKVVLFTTCYGNRNMPSLNEDLVAVFEHNGIPIVLVEQEVCCGMPKFELGDLQAVAHAKDTNIPILASWVNRGWDIVTPIPSCTLMFKQELPLMFADDTDVGKVQNAIFDPFEYLMLRHKEGELRTDFKNSLGKVSYQIPCHLRVQNIGFKTRDLLSLAPDTHVEMIERCSGHDGTYAVKKEFYDVSKKIARPVIRKVQKSDATHFVSDCPMAAEQIAQDLEMQKAEHPLGLLRLAYGI